MGGRAAGDAGEAAWAGTIDGLAGAGALALAGLDRHPAQEFRDEPRHGRGPEVGEAAEEGGFLELFEEKLADALEVEMPLLASTERGQIRTAASGASLCSVSEELHPLAMTPSN